MSAYIYLPATYGFAMMLFGATLYLRKIVSAHQLGIVSIFAIFGIILLTVLLQEIHVPAPASVQELYIACPLPASKDSWEYQLELATSPRPILGRMLQSKPVQWLLLDKLGAHSIGKYFDGSTCAPCQPGRFQSLPAQQSCELAPPGSFVGQPGSSSVVLCLAGSFSANTGASVCEYCAPGRYSTPPLSLSPSLSRRLPV